MIFRTHKYKKQIIVQSDSLELTIFNMKTLIMGFWVWYIIFSIWKMETYIFNTEYSFAIILALLALVKIYDIAEYIIKNIDD